MRAQMGVVLGVVLFTSQAFASVEVQGPDIQARSPTDFSSVCLIQVVQPATNQAYLCTGSVISSSAVLTAGHCVLDDAAQIESAQLSMMCGSQIIRQYPYKNLKVTKPDEQDWIQSQGQKVPTFSKDIAVIRFQDQTLNSAPIPIAYNGADYLSANLECILIGYGRSGSSAGKLFTSPIKDVLHYAPAYDETPMLILAPNAQGAFLRNSIDHGDSGGPLLCRQPGGGYAILGVNESGDGGLDSFNGAHYNAFTPVFNAYSSSLIKKGLGASF